MLKCLDCNHIYELPEVNIYGDTFDPERNYKECPFCGSDEHIEVKPCKVCGEYISANSYFGVCGNCEEKIRKDMKEELYNFCKNLEDFQFDILEDILSQVELTYVIRNIKNEMESEEE